MTVDARSARALELTATTAQWRRLITRDGEPIVAMPSRTTKGLYYLVTEVSCTCLDWQHYGLRATRLGDGGLHTLCLHIRALHFDRMQREDKEGMEVAF